MRNIEEIRETLFAEHRHKRKEWAGQIYTLTYAIDVGCNIDLETQIATVLEAQEYFRRLNNHSMVWWIGVLAEAVRHGDYKEIEDEDGFPISVNIDTLRGIFHDEAHNLETLPHSRGTRKSIERRYMLNRHKE